MENPGLHLSRIDVHGSTLWLHYFEQMLFSFDLVTRMFQREVPPFKAGVDDFFLLHDGRILAAMETGDIWVNTSGDWEFLTEVPYSGLRKDITRTPSPRVNKKGFGMIPAKEKIYRMVVHGDQVIVLSQFNLYRFFLDSGEWMIIPLGEWLFDAVQVTVAACPGNSFYVGFNRGEIPGGVKLIEGDTGRVITVDGRQPVNGIIPDPWNEEYMVASAGCSHRTLDFGGIYLINGDRMEPIYRQSAIYDMKLSGNYIMAAGKELLLSYDGKKFLSGPAGVFSDMNGLLCTDITKGVFQVCTNINTMISACGLTPLLAVRRI